MFSSLLRLREGHAQQTQQLLALFVGLGGGDKDHLHAANVLDLVVLDFGEEQLLTNAEGVIAAAIESLIGNAAEVTDAGSAMLTSLSMNSSMRAPRRVTFAPMF